jgi:hypothetical protein
VAGVHVGLLRHQEQAPCTARLASSRGVTAQKQQTRPCAGFFVLGVVISYLVGMLSYMQSRIYLQ